ncbi:hypothetical protein [Streptomyces sp. CT34]|nr:hypothetical protein [Streptomyces sp. CT34]
MSRPRWTKLRRDIAATRVRVAIMAAAIAVSPSAVGSLLSAQTVCPES